MTSLVSEELPTDGGVLVGFKNGRFLFLFGERIYGKPSINETPTVTTGK
jgi:hypothetical protein